MLKANWLHSKIVFYKMNKRLGVAQLGEFLPRLHGALGLVPRILQHLRSGSGKARFLRYLSYIEIYTYRESKASLV